MNRVETRKATGIEPLKLSFVSIALGFNECEELISRYVVTKDWNQVADEVHSHNLWISYVRGKGLSMINSCRKIGIMGLLYSEFIPCLEMSLLTPLILSSGMTPRITQ